MLYLLLVRGFFPLDVASPWIASAIEQQFGPGHRVEIGSTQFDHDASGAPLLRVNQIRVLGPGGNVIASAPSAEVGLEGTSLLVGNFRVRRIDLVGAETTVYVGDDGRVSIAAGRDATPLTPDKASDAAEAAAAGTVGRAAAKARDESRRARNEPFYYPQLVRWLDSFEKSGLDGVALSELGFKQSSLVVENAATGRTWNFNEIDIQLARPSEGGLLFTLSSSSPEKSWQLTATVGAVRGNARAIDIVAGNLDPGDIMLAAGISDIDYIAETPLSGILRARLDQDGRLQAAIFRASAGRGMVGVASDPEARFQLDEVQVQAHFDPERMAMIVDPLMIQIGANRLAFTAAVQAPSSGETAWPVLIPEGLLHLSSGRPGETPLVLDRVSARGEFDSVSNRLIIHKGEVAGSTAGGAFSGSLSFGPDPMLEVGLAATQIPVSAAKRLWPALIAPGTRSWAVERVEQGLIQRFLVAANVPLESIGKPHYDLPDSAVRMEMDATGGMFRAMEGTPLIRDAQVSALVTGRTARVNVSEAQVVTPQGRRITLSDGVLEVPNHIPPNPEGSIRFRFQGPADAVAEIAATELLHQVGGFTVDPDTATGAVSANVQLDLVFRKEMRGEEVRYRAEGGVKDFSASGIIRNQRVEGVNAKVSVTQDIIQVKGEGRIAGAPSKFEYQKSKSKAEANFQLTSTLDDAARSRLGLDLAPWLTGPVGIKARGRTNPSETRVDVETDLTPATVNDLVPGWQKPRGRTTKGEFQLIEHKDGIRLEQLTIAGGGTLLKGSIELDRDGDFVAANLPVFHLSDGDKASLRAERLTDGTMRVSVRGDLLDARSAIRSLTARPAETSAGQDKPRDLDLELRLGAATGHNGEVARQVDLRLVRKGGRITTFSLIGRVGRDASMVGELRARTDGSPALYVTTGDAGALFRFSDFYTRIYGGEAWIVIDPPSPDGSPQDGVLNVRDFVIRGEPGLDRMLAAAPATDATDQRPGSRQERQGIAFLRMQIDFNRTPGRFNIRESLIYGPTMGANVDGVLDFANDRVQLRGTYIPAYGLNNLFAQIPVVGLFLGGPREGLVAITFEIVGPTSGPTLRVNPMSAAAPGFLRKLFEFRGAADMPPPINR